jgi:hypothetical protein
MARESDADKTDLRGPRPFGLGMTIDGYLEGFRRAELDPDETRLVLMCAEAFKGLGMPTSHTTSPVVPFFHVLLADRAFLHRYGGSRVLLAAQSATPYIPERSYLQDAENAIDFIEDPSPGVDPLASSLVRLALLHLREQQRRSPSRDGGALLTRILDACAVHAADAGPSSALKAAERARALYQDLLAALLDVRARLKGDLSAVVAGVRVPESYANRQKESVLLRLRRRPLAFQGQLALMADWMLSSRSPELKKAYTPAEVAKVWYWRIESCFNDVSEHKLLEPTAPKLLEEGADAIIEEVERRLRSAHELVSRKKRPTNRKRTRGKRE